mmetsp:Transcript_27924/g.47173  ORF Transcript_27924/g.47173 Transcript_27924/m.47173 type:complete len:86 (+) Transcript_27924:273-530(+)
MDVIEIGNEKFLLFDFNGRYYCESNIFMHEVRPTTGLEFFLRGVDDLTPEEISRMKQYFRLNRAASRQEVAPLRVLTTVSQVVCL